MSTKKLCTTTHEEYYHNLNSLMMSLVLNFVVRRYLKRDMQEKCYGGYELLSSHSGRLEN